MSRAYFWALRKFWSVKPIMRHVGRIALIWLIGIKKYWHNDQFWGSRVMLWYGTNLEHLAHFLALRELWIRANSWQSRPIYDTRAVPNFSSLRLFQFLFFCMSLETTNWWVQGLRETAESKGIELIQKLCEIAKIKKS